MTETAALRLKAAPEVSGPSALLPKPANVPWDAGGFGRVRRLPGDSGRGLRAPIRGFVAAAPSAGADPSK